MISDGAVVATDVASKGGMAGVAAVAPVGHTGGVFTHGGQAAPGAPGSELS